MSSRRRVSSRLSKTTCVSFASSSSAILPPLSSINFEIRSKLIMSLANVVYEGMIDKPFHNRILMLRGHSHAVLASVKRSVQVEIAVAYVKQDKTNLWTDIQMHEYPLLVVFHGRVFSHLNVTGVLSIYFLVLIIACVELI